MRWQLEEYTLVNHGFGQLNHGLVFTDKADAKNAPLTRPARDCKTEDHSIGDQGHGICFDQMRCEAVAKRVRRDVLCPGFFTAVLSAVWKERMPTYLQAGYLLGKESSRGRYCRQYCSTSRRHCFDKTAFLYLPLFPCGTEISWLGQSIAPAQNQRASSFATARITSSVGALFSSFDVSTISLYNETFVSSATFL